MRPVTRGASSSRLHSGTARTGSRGEHNKQSLNDAPFREPLPNKHQREARVPQAIAAREQLQHDEGNRQMSINDALKQITTMRRRGSFAMPDYHGDTFASAGTYSDGHVYLSRRRSFNSSTGGLSVPHKSPWQAQQSREDEALQAASEAAALQGLVKNHDPSQDVNANIRRALGLKTAVIELNEMDPLGNLVNVNPDDMTKGNPFLEGFKPLFEQVREAQRAAGIDLSLLTEANKAREAAALENSRPQLRREKSTKGGDKGGRAGADRHPNPDAEPEIVTVVEAPAWYGDAGIQPQLVKAMQLNTFLGIAVAHVPAETLTGQEGALAAGIGVRKPVSRERTSRLSRHDPRMHRFRILPHDGTGSGESSATSSRTPTRRSSKANTGGGQGVHWGDSAVSASPLPSAEANKLDRAGSASFSEPALRSPRSGGRTSTSSRRGSMGGSPAGSRTHFALLEVCHRSFPDLEAAVDAVLTAVLYVAELEEGLSTDVEDLRAGELPPLAVPSVHATAGAQDTATGDMLDYPLTSTAPLPVLHAHARPSFLENGSGGPDSPGPHDVLLRTGPGAWDAGTGTGAAASGVDTQLYRGYNFLPNSSVSSMPQSVLGPGEASGNGSGLPAQAQAQVGAQGEGGKSSPGKGSGKHVSMREYTGVGGAGASLTEGEAMGSQFGGHSVLSATGAPGGTAVGRGGARGGVETKVTPATAGRAGSAGHFGRPGTFKGFSPTSSNGSPSPSRGKSTRNLMGTGVASPPQGAMPVLVFQRHAGANAEETAAARAVELATAGYERWFAAGVQGGDLRQFEAKVRRQKVFARLTAEKPRRGVDAESPKLHRYATRTARSASPPHQGSGMRSSSAPAGLHRTSRSAGSPTPRPTLPPALLDSGTGAAGVIAKGETGSARPGTGQSVGRRSGGAAGGLGRRPPSAGPAAAMGAPYRAKSPLVTSRGAATADGQVRFYSPDDEKEEALATTRSAALKILRIKEEREEEAQQGEGKASARSRGSKGSRASSASSAGRRVGTGRASATRTRPLPTGAPAPAPPSVGPSVAPSSRPAQQHASSAAPPAAGQVEPQGSFDSIEESLDVLDVLSGGLPRIASSSSSTMMAMMGQDSRHSGGSPTHFPDSAAPVGPAGGSAGSGGAQDVFEQISVRMQASLKEIADRYMPKPYPAPAPASAPASKGSQLLSARGEGHAHPGGGGSLFLSASQVLARTQSGGPMASSSSPLAPHPSASHPSAAASAPRGGVELDGDDLEIAEAREAQAARAALQYPVRPQSKGAAHHLNGQTQSNYNRGGTQGRGAGTGGGSGSALELYLQQVQKKASVEGSVMLVADLAELLSGQRPVTAQHAAGHREKKAQGGGNSSSSRPVQSSQQSRSRAYREGAGGGMSEQAREELETAAAMAAALLAAAAPKGKPGTPAGHGARAVRALGPGTGAGTGAAQGVFLPNDMRPVPAKAGSRPAAARSRSGAGISSEQVVDVAESKADSLPPVAAQPLRRTTAAAPIPSTQPEQKQAGQKQQAEQKQQEQEEAAAVFLQGMVEMADGSEEEEEPPAAQQGKPASASAPQAPTPVKRAPSSSHLPPSPVVVIGTPAGTPSPSREPVQAVGVVVLPPRPP